jgi:hypothetical protein
MKEKPMLSEEMNAINDPWNFLQQPVHPHLGLNASMRALLAAVDQGWEIVQPVRNLPAQYPGAWMYAVALLHPETARELRLQVPGAPESDRFFSIHDIAID